MFVFLNFVAYYIQYFGEKPCQNEIDNGYQNQWEECVEST